MSHVTAVPPWWEMLRARVRVRRAVPGCQGVWEPTPPASCCIPELETKACVGHSLPHRAAILLPRPWMAPSCSSWHRHRHHHSKAGYPGSSGSPAPSPPLSKPAQPPRYPGGRSAPSIVPSTPWWARPSRLLMGDSNRRTDLPASTPAPGTILHPGGRVGLDLTARATPCFKSSKVSPGH